MKITIYINRELLNEAMALVGTTKITEVINLALNEFIRRRRLEMLSDKLGRLDYGLTLDDLEEIRRDD
jgi:hypothetical protein